MKTEKNLKTINRIIAATLAFALLLTSVITGDITTAYAANTPYYAEEKVDIYDIKDTVVTVEPGDMINIKHMSGTYNNSTRLLNWTSSDESVATLHVKYGIGIESPIGYNIDPLDIERVRGYLEINSYDLIAWKPGTTVITAAYKDDPSSKYYYSYSFTLKVKAPKKTAKQRHCKNHKWVTTEKATCCRPGVRTCKKCKLQRVTPLANHKYQTESVTRTLYPAYIAPACEGCNTVFDPLSYGTFEYGTEDWNKNKFTMESYDAAFDAAMSALREHELECEGYKEFWADPEADYWGNWFAAQLYDYSHPYEETRNETKCKYCGFYKEWIEEIFTGE